MRFNWNKLLCGERAYPSPVKNDSPETGDSRSEFQRDYHRIIGSASFRRLQDKTQVFPLDRGDFVRTRLTHSLEVASFAKSLGQMIFLYLLDKKADPELDAKKIDDICNILECSGLIHDIGNPPFGHFGEDYIRYWFRNNLGNYSFRGQRITDILPEQALADLYNFEGNAQALRLLTKLHYLVGDNGMNLTFALLNAIIKYPVPSTAIDKKSGDIRTKKMGYYLAETDIFSRATSATGAGDRRYPLTFILEAADDVAYKTADVEDAVKKGMLSCADIEKALEINREKASNDGEAEAYEEACSALKKRMSRASSDYEAVSQWLVTSVQRILLNAAKFGFTKNYEAIMRGEYRFDLLKGTRGETLADVLAGLTAEKVFRSKDIYKLEIAAENILGFLLGKFVGAFVDFDPDAPRGSSMNDRITALVSENYLAAYGKYSAGKPEEEKLYLRLLLVTDYVCGMTDGYAKKLYRELSGIS